MHSVLFVCTANICRSPIAMGLMQAKLSNNIQDWRIESAGTWAIENEPAVSKTLAVLKEKGIDISNHHSRQITAEMLDSFQLILTMEKGHKEAIRVEFPNIADRVYLLSEMVGQVYDIRDPIGGPITDFQNTVSDIEKILSMGLTKIIELATED